MLLLKKFSGLRAKIRFVILPVFWLILIFYITFHTLQGDRGLIAYWKLRGEIFQAKLIYSEIINNKFVLENRVKLLSSRSLDLDLLDERARLLLGYSKPGERMFIIR